MITIGNWSTGTARVEELRAAALGRAVCPCCEEERDFIEFLLEPGSSTLVAFCGRCRQSNRDQVRKLARTTQTEARRRVLAALAGLARRRCLRKGITRMPEEHALKLAKFPDRVAAIVAKTYAVFGDGAPVSDDQALMMIRDYLDELDPTLIERNKGKRLARSAR